MQNLLPHVRFYAMCFFMTWSVHGLCTTIYAGTERRA